MSRIVTVTPLRKTLRLTVFDGTRGSADDIGLHEFRVEERDAGPGQLAWADVDRETYHGFVAGQPVEVGTMFKQQLIAQEDGSETYGPWQAVGQASALPDRWVPVNIDRDRQAQAGNPMRRPDGTDLILPDGSQPTQPGPGEHDRHPTTGALLYDADGEPINVPA